MAPGTRGRNAKKGPVITDIQVIRPADDASTVRLRELDKALADCHENLRKIQSERESLGAQIGPGGTSTPTSMRNESGSGAGASNEEIVRAMELAVSRVLSANNNNSSRTENASTINRLAVQNQGLSFSGDQLEWLSFKRAFWQTSEFGQYSDSHNATRLALCLKGAAKEEVRSLLLSSNSGEAIMNALELKYGNKEVILRHLVNMIRKLPSMKSGNCDIISFASTVKNNVAAIKEVGDCGYIANPELLGVVVRKLPVSLIHGYEEYIRSNNCVSDLKALGEFLYQRAVMASNAGTISAFTSEKSSLQQDDRDPRKSRKRAGQVLTTSESKKARVGPEETRVCRYCQHKGHLIYTCRKFLALESQRRWRWVKDQSLCFKCINSKHLCQSCNAQRCNVEDCGRPHHALLHNPKHNEVKNKSPDCGEPADSA